MAQVFAHSQNPRASHILNVLDLPGVDGPTADSKLASESTAWWKVTGTPGNEMGYEHFPVEDTRWSLVGLKRALHRWHVDAEGLATWVQPMCGMKWWLLARRKDGSPFSRNQFWVEMDPDKLNCSEWIVEAVVLRAGTRL